MSYLEDGVVTLEEIQLPSEERLGKGAAAVIECVQLIPCNPCVDACPQKAITIRGSINNTPEMDFDLCNGCGICVSNCPGLAIFLVDKTKPSVGMPYEFLPLPDKGETVELLDRAGAVCGRGEVVRIRNTKAQDRTPMVTIAMDEALVMTARFFRRIPDDH
jgi:Fe-S-cluster-containing hydrogenase component 2